jgi:hypothetical protein
VVTDHAEQSEFLHPRLLFVVAPSVCSELESVERRKIVGKHSKKEKCAACDGSGKEIKSEDGRRREVRCAMCEGSGEM